MREQKAPSHVNVLDRVNVCSDFDLDCFKMSASQHEMCAKSLPMYCGTTDEYCGELEPKDGHCPFEVAP